VIDNVPRELSADQKSALRVLARHVMTQLELRRHSHELANAHKLRAQVESDLEKAHAEIALLRSRLGGKPASGRARGKRSAS